MNSTTHHSSPSTRYRLVQMIIWIVLLAIIATLLMLFAIPCFGQTNELGVALASPATTGQGAPSPAWLDKTSADASALLGDFGVTVSADEMRGLLSLGMAVFLFARVGRKAIPDAWQTGRIGSLLKHAALEINPGRKIPPPTSTSLTN